MYLLELDFVDRQLAVALLLLTEGLQPTQTIAFHRGSFFEDQAGHKRIRVSFAGRDYLMRKEVAKATTQPKSIRLWYPTMNRVST